MHHKMLILQRMYVPDADRAAPPGAPRRMRQELGFGIEHDSAAYTDFGDARRAAAGRRVLCGARHAARTTNKSEY